MTRCQRKLRLIVMMALLLWPIMMFAQAQSDTNSLKPFTTCKLPGDLQVKEVSHLPKSAKRYREVTTMKGSERVSIMDGYRVMFAYKNLFYFFANVKVEQSDPASYLQDKERVVDSLKTIVATDQLTKISYSDKTLLNGFEHYGLDRDVIDVGGSIGIHVLFFDADHLIITAYLLNQDDKTRTSVLLGGSRRFHNIEEYRTIRDDFLNRYTECLKGIADTKH